MMFLQLAVALHPSCRVADFLLPSIVFFSNSPDFRLRGTHSHGDTLGETAGISYARCPLCSPPGISGEYLFSASKS